MRRDKFGSESTGTAIPVSVVSNRCRCTVYFTYRTTNLLVQPKFILRRERGGGSEKKQGFGVWPLRCHDTASDQLLPSTYISPDLTYILCKNVGHDVI